MINGLHNRGVALIITLAMIAMLTFLLVAFLGRTLTNLQIESASTGNARADVLAKSAGEIIVSDFKAEIVAGSVVLPGNDPLPPVYRPLKAVNAVPSLTRYGFSIYDAPTFVNLVKESTGRFFPNTPDYPNATPIIQAVTSLTTDTLSQNRRSVINKRWDNPVDTLAPLGPQLLVSKTPATYTRFYDNKMLPHWVMMTRNGVPALQDWTSKWKDYSTANPDAAIGRFAYNVYDVGGLIDVNAAGYPETSLPNSPGSGNYVPPPDVVSRKGTIGLAQLSVIPGIDSAINATQFIHAWRNLASNTTADDYLAYLGFSQNGANNLLGSPFYKLGPKNGFLKPAFGTASADNRILGRQDLIRLAIKVPNAGASPTPTPSPAPAPPVPTYGLSLASLPYLTHFSRESNAPGWYPVTPAGSTIDYTAQADTDSVANRSLPKVRLPTGSTWLRLTGEKAAPGEPLIKYRFPLSWLALLQNASPGSPTWSLTSEAEAIIKAFDTRRQANGGPVIPGTTLKSKAEWLVQQAFGLNWNATENRWDYKGSYGDLGSANTRPILNKIEVLGSATSSSDSVVKESREPNFFELLKAGILSGSLGNSSDYESFCANIGNDSNPDYQIMQIGANIIDQADADSYPTRIAFGYEMDTPNNVVSAKSASNSPTQLADVKVFSGVEDLPCLQSILTTPYRIPSGQPNLGIPTPPDVNQTPTQDYFNAWLQFVLWKPQQAPAASSVRPAQFRIVCTTGLPATPTVPDGVGINILYEAAPAKGAFLPLSGQVQRTSPILNSATISFADSLASFRAPTLLGGMGATSTDSFDCSQIQGNGKNPSVAQSGGLAQLPRGMWLGETYRPETDYIPNSPNRYDAPQTKAIELRCSANSRFELQYLDGGSTWRTYQRFNRFGLGSGSSYNGRGLYGFSNDWYRSGNPNPLPLNSPNYPAYHDLDVAQLAVSLADPRSQRFGLMAMYLDPPASGPQQPDIPNGWVYYLKQGWWPSGTGNTYRASFNPSNARFSPNWSGNTKPNPWSGHDGFSPITNPTNFFADNPGNGDYYKDPDGIARRGDGNFANTVRPMQLSGATTPNTPSLGIVINRPFRSVGELSYTFRDVPWKSLDFFSTNSADSALLDIFSVDEQPAMVAGKVNLNTRNPAVLQAVIVGAAREELSTSNMISASDALTIATNLVTNSTDASGNANTGPLQAPGEIANRLNAIIPLMATGTPPDQAIKTRREVVGRALAGSGQTRTWNFLIDVIAQSGRYAPNATATAQFVVEGEKRYWLHVAIDRFTGKIIDQQLEPVME